MDLTLNDTQELIQDGARRLLTDAYDSDVIRAAEQSDVGFAAELWTQIAELGWTALALPEDVGGGGCGLLDLCILAEQLGRAAASTPLVDTAGFAASFLRAIEPTTLSAELLRQLATTATVIVPALADADNRDDRSAPSSVLTEADDGVSVSGAKVLVPFAHAAQVLLVSVTTPNGDPAVVAIDADADGASRTRHDATGGVPLFLVEFDDVTVAPECVLARGAAADRALDAARDAATVLATAEAVGLCEAMTLLGAEYAANRKQFGQPIGGFQAVAHRLADMRINTDACRLLVAEAAWMLDQGGDATLEVAGTKVFANEVVVEMIHSAHAVHGAIGYSTEYDLQLFTRRARAFCLSHGDTDRQTERAAVALGL